MHSFRKFSNYQGLAEKGVLLLIVIAVGFIGYQYAFYTGFSTLPFWDDEGTMLLRVRAFLEDPTSFSISAGVYGPFYYLSKYVIYGLIDAGVTHDINRYTTIAFWLYVSLAIALTTYQLTRSITLTTLTLLQGILTLGAFAQEPGHPHEIGMALIFSAVLMVTCFQGRRIQHLLCILLGAFTAALLLTKVNLGLFFLLSAGLTLTTSLKDSTLRRFLLPLASIIALIMPFALTRKHLENTDTLLFSLSIASAIGCTLIISTSMTRARTATLCHLLVYALSTLLAVLCICVPIIMMGNSPGAIAQSVVLRALSMPTAFSYLQAYDGIVVAFILVSVGVACLYRYWHLKIHENEKTKTLVFALKAAFGAYALLLLMDESKSVISNPLIIPFCWISLVGLPQTDSDWKYIARLFLCWLATTLPMQAYPVAGTQATLAILPIISLAILNLHDSRIYFSQFRYKLVSERSLSTSYGLTVSVVCSAVLFALYFQLYQVGTLRENYRNNLVAIDQTGTKNIKLSKARSNAIRGLAEDLKKHCDGFLGVPGFASLYFWTSIRPPGVVNNAWIINMPHDEQLKIVQRMEAYKSPCIVYSPSVFRFWSRGQNLNVSQPLAKHIKENYSPFKTWGRYLLLKKA